MRNESYYNPEIEADQFSAMLREKSRTEREEAATWLEKTPWRKIDIILNKIEAGTLDKETLRAAAEKGRLTLLREGFQRGSHIEKLEQAFELPPLDWTDPTVLTAVKDSVRIRMNATFDPKKVVLYMRDDLRIPMSVLGSSAIKASFIDSMNEYADLDVMTPTMEKSWEEAKAELESVEI